MKYFNNFVLIFALFCAVQYLNAEDNQNEDGKIIDKTVMRAIVESCSGWRLNHLPEVKRFIYDDLPLFHNVEFIIKPGSPPYLHLLNKDGDKVETIDLSAMSKDECNSLLIKKGFFRREQSTDEVPVEFQQGPYKPSIEL